MQETQPLDPIGFFSSVCFVHKGGMIYGYARVSTDGQTVAAQVATLTAAGAGEVFGEVATGARTDRLARSTRNLLNSPATSTERKAAFRSLGDTWADTTTAHGRLMLTVLGGLAKFQRELIRARTGEGRARAKARGMSLGRPFKLTAHQRQEALARRDGGELVSEIARSYNVSSSTISRLAA